MTPRGWILLPWLLLLGFAVCHFTGCGGREVDGTTISLYPSPECGCGSFLTDRGCERFTPNWAEICPDFAATGATATYVDSDAGCLAEITCSTVN